MKKWLIVVGLGLMTGSLYAACNGPYCWDDTGASIGGKSFNGNGYDVPVLSSTSIAALSGFGIGRTVICNSCNAFGTSNSYNLCIATSTTQPAFVLVSTPTVICR